MIYVRTTTLVVLELIHIFEKILDNFVIRACIMCISIKTHCKINMNASSAGQEIFWTLLEWFAWSFIHIQKKT